MKKFFSFMLWGILTIIAIINTAYASGLDTNLPKDTSLYQFIGEYACYQPPADFPTVYPIVPYFDIETEGVHIQADAIAFDGEILFTSVNVRPTNAEEILILPGSASKIDIVAGMNGENKRHDHRTFLESALEDGKKLLAVYAYPQEFDILGTYFLDHYQMDDDLTVLFSGAYQEGGLPTQISWLIEVYDVDLTTGQYSLLTRMLSDPQDITYVYSNEK